MNTNINRSTPALWRRITATVIGAGAIAVGAMAMSAPANAETFQQSCINHPGAYADGAVRGEYSTYRAGNDRYEVCKVYAANGKLLGTTQVPNYGWYTKHGLIDPVSPPPAAQR